MVKRLINKYSPSGILDQCLEDDLALDDIFLELRWILDT